MINRIAQALAWERYQRQGLPQSDPTPEDYQEAAIAWNVIWWLSDADVAAIAQALGARPDQTVPVLNVIKETMENALHDGSGSHG